MTEPTPQPRVNAQQGASERRRRDRRGRRDRRANAAPGRRGGRARRWLLGSVAKDIAIAALLTAAIAFTVSRVRPIFAGQHPLVAELTATGGWARDSTVAERIVASPEFEADRKAFAADLVATGRVEPARADSIAYYAVREAYVRGIPPAVIFGVMLTENALFVSSATSNVGAVGLMQIYPKIWLKELGDRFGTDLVSDSTNVKYGAFILSEYIKSKSGDAVTPADIRRGLLKYNGCVHGTNTPHCHNYPQKVEQYVEKEGSSLCGNKSFYDCIARPFVAGLFGETPAN